MGSTRVPSDDPRITRSSSENSFAVRRCRCETDHRSALGRGRAGTGSHSCPRDPVHPAHQDRHGGRTPPANRGSRHAPHICCVVANGPRALWDRKTSSVPSSRPHGRASSLATSSAALTAWRSAASHAGRTSRVAVAPRVGPQLQRLVKPLATESRHCRRPDRRATAASCRSHERPGTSRQCRARGGARKPRPSPDN
jgi:hypothetical protein